MYNYCPWKNFQIMHKWTRNKLKISLLQIKTLNNVRKINKSLNENSYFLTTLGKLKD